MIKLDDIVLKIQDQIKETNWWQYTRMYFLSNEFKWSIAKICNDVNNDKHFYPSLSNIFNFFKYTNPNTLKIMLYTENYGDIKSYNGLSFSSYDRYREFKQLVGSNNLIDNPMQEYAEQGVLCLNGNLTLNEAGNNYWDTFYQEMHDIIKGLDPILVHDGSCRKWTTKLSVDINDPKWQKQLKNYLNQRKQTIEW